MNQNNKQNQTPLTPPTTEGGMLDTSRALVHEIADKVPAMSDAAYAELKEDIGKNNVLEPVVVWNHDKKIIDGRHRLRACKELKIEKIPCRVWTGSEEELPGAVFAFNAIRRHLDQSQ